MKSETDHVLPCLDEHRPTPHCHHHLPEKRFTGLLTSYLSFSPFTYKMRLLKTLIGKTSKVNNTWIGFHNDLQKLFLRTLVINKCISHFIFKSVKDSKTQPRSGVKPQETPEFHYKIPYIGHFSVMTQN